MHKSVTRFPIQITVLHTEILCFSFSVLQIFCLSEHHIDLSNELFLSNCPSMRLAWHKLGHYMQNVQPNFVIPSMLIGTIDFYHFIPLLLTLTMPGGYMLIANQKLLACIFAHTFHLIWCDDEAIEAEDLRWRPSKIYWNKGNNLCCTDCVKKFNIGMHSDVLRMDLIQTWCDDRYCILHFDTGLTGLEFESRLQECEKAKTSTPIISQSFRSIWMEFGILLRLVGVMKLTLILCRPFSIQGRVPYLFDFVKKKPLTVACNLGTDFFQTCYGDRGHSAWYQFGWPWPSFKVTIVWEMNNFGVHFLSKVIIDSDEIQYVATTCWFVEAHAKFILHMYYSRERTLLTWFYECLYGTLTFDYYSSILSNQRFFQLSDNISVSQMMVVIVLWNDAEFADMKWCVNS